jgi:hypothetical protein
LTETQGQTPGLEVRVVSAGDADPEELELLTAALQRELLDVGEVEDVSRPPAGPAPPGARAIDPISIGTLIVTLAKTAAGLRAVTRAVQGWISGQPKRTVKIQLDGDTLELSDASADDQQRLVSDWIERHARE